MFSNNIEILKWDSQFFGYPVAKVTLHQAGDDNMENIFQQLALEKIRLTYFFVPTEEFLLIKIIERFGGILVDQKTIFSKPTEKHNKFHNSIIEFLGEEINERLIELVLQAGLYSRFRIDENFKNKEFERLYFEWLVKSVDKSIAFKILLANIGSEIVGITTLSEKGQKADIGLVSVDEKYRGQGIGRDLINSADTVAYERGLNEINVVTQLKNRGACLLYEKCHFHIEKITNIYHYWQK